MIKLVHTFEGGRSVLCTDGHFHNEVMVGKIYGGRKITAKFYKSEAAANRKIAQYAHLGDYAQAVNA